MAAWCGSRIPRGGVVRRSVRIRSGERFPWRTIVIPQGRLNIIDFDSFRGIAHCGPPRARRVADVVGIAGADIYALTILEDAGLEIVSIEVTGGE